MLNKHTFKQPGRLDLHHLPRHVSWRPTLNMSKMNGPHVRLGRHHQLVIQEGLDRRLMLEQT